MMPDSMNSGLIGEGSSDGSYKTTKSRMWLRDSGSIPGWDFSSSLYCT
jgi:hypothetical protein